VAGYTPKWFIRLLSVHPSNYLPSLMTTRTKFLDATNDFKLKHDLTITNSGT